MGIDGLFMEFVHGMCVAGGVFFTPFLRVTSLLGEIYNYANETIYCK